MIYAYAKFCSDVTHKYLCLCFDLAFRTVCPITNVALMVSTETMLGPCTCSPQQPVPLHESRHDQGKPSGEL